MGRDSRPAFLGEAPGRDALRLVGLSGPPGRFPFLGEDPATVYILYLDESGVPEKHPSQTSHYILLGAAIYEGTWFALEKRINDIKSGFALGDPHKLELHASWLIRPYFEQGRVTDFNALTHGARREAALAVRTDFIEHVLPTLPGRKRHEWRKYFRSTDAALHLTFDERRRLYRRVLDAVANHRTGLYLFAEAIDKTALALGVDPVEQSFAQVIARFEGFLKSRPHPQQWGLIAADRDEHKAGRLQAMLALFQQVGTVWRDIERVIEAPFFFDSASSSGVQITDLCAYALRRYLEKKEVDGFRRIFPKFYRARGKLHGLRHYTRRGACRCLICTERKFAKEELEAGPASPAAPPPDAVPPVGAAASSG